MKLVMPISSDRIAGVFDFARQLLVVEYEEGRKVSRKELRLDEAPPVNRARRLQALGKSMLICGAISRSVVEHLAGSGIDVIPFVSGRVEEVLPAYFAGRLDSAAFLMSGSTSQERSEWRSRGRIR
jgi:predicted Fe-Mo cluster-binding NifX family protein